MIFHQHAVCPIALLGAATACTTSATDFTSLAALGSTAGLMVQAAYGTTARGEGVAAQCFIRLTVAADSSGPVLQQLSVMSEQ